MWRGARGTPQPPSAAPSLSLSCSAAETLQVFHVSWNILTFMVFSGCEMEVKDHQVEERVYL